MIKIIIFLAIIGLLDSVYTAFQQKFPKLFSFCFTRNFKKRTNCHEILHSKYAKIFVIPNSWLGIIGYALLTIIYYYANVFSVIEADRLLAIGALLSTTAFVFSYYLLYVQAFTLKKFCIFCLTSTAIITIITILSLRLII